MDSWFVWTLIGYFSGSLMFSVWIGHIFLKKDIRSYGDKNPGATNVFRAGGKVIGVLAIVLDITKAALPIGIAHWILGIQGAPLIPVALAPVLGHAYSPFLRFKGGKALATSGGMWIGLTILYMPLILMPMLLYWFYWIKVSGWAVMFTAMSGLLGLLIGMPDPVLIAIMLLNTLIAILKHQDDLRQPILLRPRLWLRRYAA